MSEARVRRRRGRESKRVWRVVEGPTDRAGLKGSAIQGPFRHYWVSGAKRPLASDRVVASGLTRDEARAVARDMNCVAETLRS